MPCSAPAGAVRTRSRWPRRIAARTTTFDPLIAIRPGYWRPAHFASAAATLDQLSRGRVRVNIVSGQDNLHQYGDVEGDQAERYARTKEFMRLVRRLWTEENVTFEGEHFSVTESTVSPRPVVQGDRIHPRLYFGGASEPAEKVSATESDVQLFWGEPLDGVAERIARLKGLEQSLERDLPPLEFGLRITTLVRDTTEEAWHDAEEKVAKMAEQSASGTQQQWFQRTGFKATGQQRLLDLAERGDVLDTCLYTAPGSTAAAGPAPPGWWARPRTSRTRCGSTRSSGSATSCSRTRRTRPRSAGWATRCSRCCVQSSWSRSRPDCRRKSLGAQAVRVRLLLAAAALRRGGRRCGRRAGRRARTPVRRTRCPNPSRTSARRLVGRDHVLRYRLGSGLSSRRTFHSPFAESDHISRLGSAGYSSNGTVMNDDVVEVGLAELVGQVDQLAQRG